VRQAKELNLLRNNLKIGARLTLDFSFVLALMAIIVFIAVTRLSALNDGSCQ
jgi:hypothetical protein